MKIIKKILKWTGITVLTLLVILTIVIITRQNLTFDAPYPNIHASSDSAVIAKGKYLFYGPAHCMDCHANKPDYPQITEVEKIPPTGNFLFALPIGDIRTPNLTSDKETGIARLSDVEIARTLRYGVGSDGRAMLDFMPFHNTSDEDLTAIISYLRTIPAVKKEVPKPEYNLLGKIIKAFLLKPVGPEGEVAVKVKEGPTVEYGKYLANSVANCSGCHTNRNMMTGEAIGESFAGGLKLEVEGKPGEFIVTRNLTPDPETGHIYNWSEEQFINRFRAGKVIPGTIMPWDAFSHMSDDDLKAIFRYLNTIKPVKNDCGPVLINENAPKTAQR